MLEHPVYPPVLAMNSMAVTIREVRAISRKGSDEAQCERDPGGHRPLSGRVHRWRRKFQCVVSSSERLQTSLESLTLFQYLPTRRSHPGAVQTASGMRDDATETRWRLVLRSEQLHRHH